MPKLNPIVIELRNTTVEAVQELICSGKYLSEKTALNKIYNIAKLKKIPTGFYEPTSPIDFQLFYSRYRYYRCITKQKQTRPKPEATDEYSNYYDTSMIDNTYKPY